VTVLFVSSSPDDLENENIVWDFCFSNAAGEKSGGIDERNWQSTALLPKKPCKLLRQELFRYLHTKLLKHALLRTLLNRHQTPKPNENQQQIFLS
jgi:hypothetical protein